MGMDDAALRPVRELITQLGRGANVLDALYDEALTLLDEHDHDLDERWRAYLDDVRYVYHEAITTRSPKDRAALVARLAASGRALVSG